ncbi:MAG: lysozyme, partial [Candidimonas sp.]
AWTIRHVSDDGRALIEHYEGCKFEPYTNAAGALAIGYGDTRNVKPGMRITLPEADERLRSKLAREFEPHVLASLVRAPRQHEFDAMVSFAHDIGTAAFKKSALVKLYNDHNPTAAADEFLRGDSPDDEREDSPDDGALRQARRRRRAAERALFQGLVFVDAIRIGDATP